MCVSAMLRSWRKCASSGVESEDQVRRGSRQAAEELEATRGGRMCLWSAEDVDMLTRELRKQQMGLLVGVPNLL